MARENPIISTRNSYINNIRLLKNRRDPFNKDKLEGYRNSYRKAIRIKRISVVKMERLRLKLQREKRQETLRIIFALVTATGISLAIILIIIHYIKEYITR